MDSSRKGWLSEYIRKKQEVENQGVGMTDEFKGIHPDQTLYAIIQPTGIMYGHPVGEGKDANSRTKLNLMDSLLSSYSLIKENQGEYFATISETYSKGVTAIADFYNLVYPELYTSQTSLFGKKKADDEILEKILDKRLNRDRGNDFWSGFFHKSLLFLDIYFFRQFVLAGGDELIINFLRGQKDLLRLDVIKVMTAAAHANRSIEPEERQLFGYLIESLDLPPDKKEYALDYFEKGNDYDNSPLPSEDTWILKKYLFEVAILTTWADRKIEESEEHFLRDYNSKLGFIDLEYERSMIAVEGFVLEYWEELSSLKDNTDYQLVSNEYKMRLREMVNTHSDKLKAEISRNENLLTKIFQAQQGKLDEKGKEKLGIELIECLESVPVFDIITLPRNYLTLQILMEILPPDFFSGINQLKSKL